MTVETRKLTRINLVRENLCILEVSRSLAVLGSIPPAVNYAGSQDAPRNKSPSTHHCYTFFYIYYLFIA